MNEKNDIKHIRELLENRFQMYNRATFVASDPICVPHQFTSREDREVAGFLVATISWGNRKSIIANGLRLMQCMDFAPHDFIRNFSEKDLLRFDGFIHRTFNVVDLGCFLFSLKNIYANHGGMEALFYKGLAEGQDMKQGITNFRKVFFEIPHPGRSRKHVSNPETGSAAKRLNMFLRWMVRRDEQGVDFGIWKSISPQMLYCPLDVHSGRVARKLGLLKRKQDDWKAVEELTANLRLIDPEDPVRFDYALFGLGVFERFG